MCYTLFFFTEVLQAWALTKSLGKTLSPFQAITGALCFLVTRKSSFNIYH